MPKSDIKAQPKVIMNIQAGPVTPHQRKCWGIWWAARIAEAKSEAKNE